MKEFWEFEGLEQGAFLGFEFQLQLGRSLEVISRSWDVVMFFLHFGVCGNLSLDVIGV